MIAPTDYVVNVNKHVIAANARTGRNDPPIRISKGTSGKGTYCHEIELPPGSTMIYSPHEPLLKCGARLVVKCPEKPQIIR